jgi:AcrR family transcriptional regulator
VPRIRADTIAEHVAQQEAAVLDAAVRLFVERGYREVSLADVAAEVGLARSSLYRYVPDKAHLLVQWYRREVPAQTEAWTAIVTGDGTPVERLQRWALAHLAYSQTPESTLIPALQEELVHLDDATRAEIAESHRGLMDTVGIAVAAAGVPADEVDGVVAVLAGMVVGAARVEGATGTDERLRRRLLAAVAALVDG